MTPEARAPSPGEAEIGPNAVLQTVPAIEQRLGQRACAAILAEAGLDTLPTGESMIREADALALMRALHRHHPREAPAIAREAGWATADYIIANRIPRPVAALLRLLPAPLAARALMAAISRHAWTFVGAGRFEPEGPWSFTIDRRAAGDDAAPPACLFDWYAAVFTRLFGELVAARAQCRALSRPGGAAPLRHYRIERRGSPATAGRAAASGEASAPA